MPLIHTHTLTGPSRSANQGPYTDEDEGLILINNEKDGKHHDLDSNSSSSAHSDIALVH